MALAVESAAWMQNAHPRSTDMGLWEPKRLRLRLFTPPPTIARTGDEPFSEYVQRRGVVPGPRSSA
jgi:hypothetical protein